MSKDDFLKMLFVAAAVEELSEAIKSMPDGPVTEAYFKVCPNCGGHGRIYTKKVFTSELISKVQALDALNQLKGEGEVDEAEFNKVKAEIESSKLP